MKFLATLRRLWTNGTGYQLSGVHFNTTLFKAMEVARLDVIGQQVERVTRTGDTCAVTMRSNADGTRTVLHLQDQAIHVLPTGGAYIMGGYDSERDPFIVQVYFSVTRPLRADRRSVV